jgi:shikimate dehydrogenase
MDVPYAEVIGDPIAHSKSPIIHNFWLERLGLEGGYRRTRVAAEDLGAFLAERRNDPFWRGCNVTMPHKQTILPLLDTVTGSAAAIGAVNTVRRDEDGRLHGRNTDVHGIWRALDGVEMDGLEVLLVGAGGAARAAAFVLSRCENVRVIAMNRSPSHAEELLSEFRLPGRAIPLASFPAVDLVINASAMGMSHAPWPILDLGALPSHATVFDMVYDPLHTPLLGAADERGLKKVDGLTMLIHQAAEAFGTFYGEAPPSGDNSELRELLTR